MYMIENKLKVIGLSPAMLYYPDELTVRQEVAFIMCRYTENSLKVSDLSPAMSY